MSPSKTKDFDMAFLKTDLARNLGLGFFAGAILAVVANPGFTHVVTGLL